MARYGGSIPAPLKPVIAERLLHAAATPKNRDVRSTLVMGIAVVGSRSNLSALRSLLESADSAILREDILAAIESCGTKDP